MKAPRMTATVVAALALLALPVGEAAAGTQVLRPTSDYSKSFDTNPSGRTAASVFDDDVLQPAPPSISGDYAYPRGSDDGSAAVLFPAASVAPGSTLSHVSAWVHAGTGNKRTIWFGLWAGSTYLTGTTIAKSQAPGWHSVTTTAALTAGQLAQLAMYIGASDGDNETGKTAAYAAYVEVQTNDPPPAPALPAPDLTTDASLLGPVFAPSTQGTAASSSGRVGVPVACPLGEGNVCQGVVTLELAPTPGKASIARRGARIVGRQTFAVRSGRTSNVHVLLGRGARRLLKRQGSLRVSARISRRGAPNLEQRKTVTVRKPKLRRRRPVA